MEHRKRSARWMVALILGAWSSSVLSQEVVHNSGKISANLSLGYNASMRAHFTAIAGFGLDISDGADLYGVHLFHTTEMIGLGGGDTPIGIDENISGIGVTYGRSHSFTLGRLLFPFFPIALLAKHETRYLFSASIGLSLNKTHLHGGPIAGTVGSFGEQYYTYEFRDRLGVGVPVQLELVQMLTKSVGYIHRVYANVNSYRSFWSFSWAVQYGW